ncbi:MAG: glycosyltransferase family 39 protein, partial [Acidobacteria bacterium]|nr:glycosyltransferase family 39 protein [Acidobacteriota bacterium]
MGAMNFLNTETMTPQAAVAEGGDRTRAILHQPYIILLAFTLAGLCLRLYGLGDKSLWLDELKSIEHAHFIHLGTLFAPLGGDAHPPLFFVLLKGWLLLGDSEFHLRLLSVVPGTLVIPATYLLGRQFLPVRACLLSALLAAVSPFLLLHDREVRMYPLLVLWTTLSLYFFIKALRENRMQQWVGFTVFTCLNVYTHYHSFLVLASMWLFFVLRFKQYRQAWKALVLSHVVIAMAFIPWLPTFFYHLRRFSEFIPLDLFPAVWGGWLKPLYLFFSLSLGQTVMPWNFLVVIPGAIIFAFLFVWGIKSLYGSTETLQFVVVFLFFPIFLALLKSTFMPRYLVFVAPIFYLVIGEGISAIDHPKLRACVIALMLSAVTVPLQNYYTNREFHILHYVDPLREVGNYLRENVQADDYVMNMGGGVGRVIKYYWGGDAGHFWEVTGTDMAPSD